MPDVPEDERAAAERLFLELQELIDKIVHRVARRWWLRPQDEEDLKQNVSEKLIADDYAVLRGFRQQSTMETFLTTVINRLYLDRRTRDFGKWRPSAEAQLMGVLAEEVERLVYREGRSLEETAGDLSLQTNERITSERVAAILSRLPVRYRPREPHELDPEVVPTREPGPEDLFLRQQAERTASRVAHRLSEAIERLRAEDQLLVRLAFFSDMSIALIARTLGLLQRPLYRRLERCLRDMRRTLESQGISREDVALILDPREVHLAPLKNLPRGAESVPSGPSMRRGKGSGQPELRGEER